MGEEMNRVATKNAIKRVVMTIGASGLLAAALAALAASATAPASASTIPDGKLQLCVQGNYPAFIHVLPASLGSGATTRGLASHLVSPGDCWISSANTAGQWAQVDVVGIRDDGSQFYIGSQWYNSSVSGLGLGAEGSEESPYIWHW
jgi:hypothetical protein